MLHRQTYAYVLQVSDYDESDVIVTLYSSDIGKFKAIAKGAKRSRKRFVNKLEIFSLLLIQYIDKYSLPILDQAELINSYLTIRQNYKLFCLSTLVCELVLNWTQENDPDKTIFDYINWTFNAFSKQKNHDQALILFLAKFYSQLGYQPDFTGCAECNTLNASGNPYSFIYTQGVITCTQCKKKKSLTTLSISTIKLLSKAFMLPMNKLSRLHLSKSSRKEALLFFKHYDRYLLDRELQSWNTLQL